MGFRTEQSFTESLIRKQRSEKKYSEPLNDIVEGILIFVSGAINADIFPDISTTNLYDACFTGILPALRTLNGKITIDYEQRSGILDLNKSRGKISLNGFIPWQLSFHGGIARVTADLRGLELNSIEIYGGVNHVRFMLPKPRSIVPVKVRGGINSLAVTCPPGTNARLYASGGVAGLSFDHDYLATAGDEILLKTPSFDGAGDRYEFRIDGGCRNLTITRQRLEH